MGQQDVDYSSADKSVPKTSVIACRYSGGTFIRISRTDDTKYIPISCAKNITFKRMIFRSFSDENLISQLS